MDARAQHDPRHGHAVHRVHEPVLLPQGTSQEKNAVNDKPGVCPGAIVNGENMDLFLDASHG